LNMTMDHGCIRCKQCPFNMEAPRLLMLYVDVKGFDVTGVVSEVDLKFPQIQGTRHP
jgi:hypothetical protein